MKDLFRAADDVYKAGLNMMHKLSRSPGFENLRPETRAVLAPLRSALEEYERSRFHRRKIIVEFEAPMPARQLTKLELTTREKTRRFSASVRVAETIHRTKKHAGEKAKM